MAGQAAEIDLTSLIASLNALIQTIGLNGRMLTSLVAEFAPATYFHIAGAGTFDVASSPGTLLSLNINSNPSGGGATLYDTASPSSLTDVIGVLNFGTVAPVTLPIGPGGRGMALNNGLVIVTTGSADVTVGLT